MKMLKLCYQREERQELFVILEDTNISPYEIHLSFYTSEPF